MTKMKRIFTIIVILLASLQAHAVLKEKDLNETLSILRSELTTYHQELGLQMQRRKEYQQRIYRQLTDVMERSNQNALMLYSQENDYIFDLTYACHEATEQYYEFQRQQTPFMAFLKQTKEDIARYDSLIVSLQTMKVNSLSRQAQQDRLVCLDLATKIRTSLVENHAQISDYISDYDYTSKRLSQLNDYAQSRYHDIQTDIFKNGGDNYFTLLKNLPMQWRRMQIAVEKKYTPSASRRSQWDSVYIFGLFVSIVIYAIIATLLNQVFFRWLLPKRFRTEEFNKKRGLTIMATTTITFAIIMGVMLATTEQNFFIMASNLLVEYAWLLGVILISLLLRVKGDQIHSAFRIYTPLLAVGFIVFAFRIILTPNELVNIAFPPILLLCTLWQWSVIRRFNKNIPRSDMFYTYISLAVLIGSTFCSWIGYTLLAVQAIIWWVMQLTCVLTITCVRLYLKQYADRHGYSEKPITKTWLYLLIYQVLLPVTSVISVMLSFWWAADVFNLSAICWNIFTHLFINMENLKVSIISIAVIICLWFFFSYISKTILALLRMHFVHADSSTAESRTVMGRNVIQVIVWGTWLIISLSIFRVNLTWLVVVSGGLSAGIGFAMKDIIENIYYGIALMTGRIKVGDWIEVEGIMGKVTSINYTSTTVNSLYGEVITLTNSQLFTKNYKNLTRNHGYVLATIPFGVAYGSNFQEVSSLVEDAVSKLRHKWTDRSKPVKVVFTEFGESSIDMKLIVWVDAVKKIYAVSDILACIYQTLNENGIEIPFPQRDLHIKDVASQLPHA